MRKWKGRAMLLAVVLLCGALATSCSKCSNCDGSADDPKLLETYELFRLDKSNLTLQSGQTAVLTANVSDDKDIVWSSADPSVATVENGAVTGVSRGVTTITAMVSEFEQATCLVEVTMDMLPCYSLQLDRTVAQIWAGSTFKLQAQLHYGDAVVEAPVLEWESTNNDVVTVDGNGSLTANAYGSALVSATYAPVNEEKVTVSCQVNVIEGLKLVLEDGQTDVKRVYPKETFDLKLTAYDTEQEVVPIDTDDVQFISSNENVVSYKNGHFYAKSSGEVTITAMYKGAGTTQTVSVWGLEPTDFTQWRTSSNKAEAKVVRKGNYLRYESTSPDVFTCNYVAISGEAWQNFLSAADAKGYTQLTISVVSVDGIFCPRPDGTSNTPFYNEAVDQLYSTGNYTENPIEGTISLSQCKEMPYLLIGMKGSGSFEFMITLS